MLHITMWFLVFKENVLNSFRTLAEQMKIQYIVIISKEKQCSYEWKNEENV